MRCSYWPKETIVLSNDPRKVALRKIKLGSRASTAGNINIPEKFTAKFHAKRRQVKQETAMMQELGDYMLFTLNAETRLCL